MKHAIRHYFLKFKYPLAILIFAIAVVFVGEGSLINRSKQKKEIQALQAEIDKYQKKFDEDKATLERLKHDPEAIKEVAREKYYMKTENEDIFVIEDQE